MSFPTRTCTDCKEEKRASREFFYRSVSDRKFGLMFRCIDCDKKKPDNRLWVNRKAKLTPEQKFKKSKSTQKFAKSHRGLANRILKDCRYADKRKGFLFDLTIDFCCDQLYKSCVYCGFPSTGLDRINNSIGHVKTNCMPCCKECNSARMDNFSVEEMKVIGSAIRAIKGARLKNSQYLLNLRL